MSELILTRFYDSALINLGAPCSAIRNKKSFGITDVNNSLDVKDLNFNSAKHLRNQKLLSGNW